MDSKREEHRLKVLSDYQILDTLPEKEYDSITRLASYICQTPIALISLVDDKRQWFKSKIGLEIAETPKSISFCKDAIQQNEIYEINNTHNNPLYKDNPLVTSSPYVQFYAGVPLASPGGQNLGTLCVIDTKPRTLTYEQKDALKILAYEVITHLETRKKNRLLVGAISKYTDIESMFSHSGELHCILNQKGKIEYINHSVKNILGYNGRDTIGWSIWKFLVKEDISAIIKTIESGLKEGLKYFEIETKTLTKSGEIRWISWYINCRKRRWYINGRDCTEEKQNEENIRQLSLVASKVNNGVVISDASNKVTWINDGFEKMTGYTLKDVIGKQLGDVIKGDDTDLIALRKVRELNQLKQSFAIDLLIKHKNGSSIWLSVMNSVVLDGNGEIETAIEILTDITSQKNESIQLETLSLAARKSSSGVLIRNPKGEVTWMNEALQLIFGYSLEEMSGKAFGELLVGEKTDYELVKHLAKLVKQNKPYDAELLIYPKSSDPKWIYISNNPVFNDFGELDRQVSTIVDITEKRNSVEQLRLLSLVASKTQDGVIISNKDGLVTWVNEGLENITKYRREEFIGKRISETMRREEKNPDETERVNKLSLDHKPYYTEKLYYDKNGDAIWLAISNTTIEDKNGEVEQKIKIVNDITKRKIAEEEMLRAKEETLSLSRAKEAFLSVMSHEIRTPLNAVIGLTHILLDDQPTASQKENLDILKFSADNLLILINDVLDYTKIETGNLILEKSEINLKQLISNTLSSLQYKATERFVILRSEIDHRIPDYIMGDNTRLYQIFMNLLGNSLKFTERGEVKLKADIVSTDSRHVKVKFVISDTGIGIAPQNIDKIFDPYTQAGEDTTRKFGGTGLGLTITKKLLELYHSPISVESEIGVGSKFTFIIEFEKVAHLAQSSDINLKERTLDKKILIVDDNQINRLLAKKILSKWGAIIEEASNGLQAADMIKNNTYDLVLMDMNMPVMDGCDACKLIRGINGSYFEKLPIIAFTASIQISDLKTMRECGMNDYVLKPFVPDQLYTTIKKYI